MNFSYYFLLITFCSVLAGALLQAQDCAEERYLTPVFSSTNYYQDVVYARDVEDFIFDFELSPENLNILLPSNSWPNVGLESDLLHLNAIDLTMDIRTPPLSDAACKRPVFIWAYPGGFVSGEKEAEDMQALIDTFARRGYVAAAIHYRIGADVTDEGSMYRAVYRASQDASAAIRFFKQNAAAFNIDTSKVFFGGSSAGALAGLHASFVDESERPADTYERYQQFFPNAQIADDLGPLHSIEVTEVSAITPSNINILPGTVPAPHWGKPRVMVSCWGAIGDLDWLDVQPGIPDVLIFHGEDDFIVHPDCAPPFSVFGVTTVAAPVTCGGIEMAPVLAANGIPVESYIEPGGFHEYWGTLNGDFDNDFLINGVGGLGPDPFYWNDMIQKIGNFSYERLRPDALPISGPTTVNACAIETYSSSILTDTDYCWAVSGGTIVNDNGSEIDVLWDSSASTGNLELIIENCAEAVSLPSTLTVSIAAPATLSITAFLEGCYEVSTGSMRTDLYDDGLLPLAQPFSGSPWNYSGTESMSTYADFPLNTVDWVLIDLIDDQQNILAQQAALLLEDGSVVSSDPTIPTGIGFCNLSTAVNYELILRHRNHVGVKSAVGVNLNGNYDFSSAPTQAADNGTYQLKGMPDGTYVLLAGDVNGEGRILTDDVNIYLAQSSLIAQYTEADCNMDGNVTVADFNLLQPNAGHLGIVEVVY